MDTIYALASAQGRAGVSVVRVSGPSAVSVFDAFGMSEVQPRELRLRRLKGANGDHLDEALVSFMPGPNTFTGEDVIELHLHGSIAIVRAVLTEVGNIPNYRIAEPGEFTRRALENNRMDLAQVEGLADLIEAETEAQRIQAQRVFGGALSGKVETWRKDLIRAAALLEATIDFADEDVPVDVTPEVSALLAGVETDLAQQISGVHTAERIRNGFEVAIVGKPNAGKSTLLNAMARRDVAITSDVAGTTRDVIEVRAEIAGLPVTLLDTAGLRDTDDEVEKIGVDRATQRADAADLRVFLLDEGDEVPVAQQPDDILVRPKADQRSDGEGAVSGKTGQGLDWLESQIADRLAERQQNVGLATHHRHKVAMEQAAMHLATAQSELARGVEGYELVAEDLRTSVRCLESLVGRIDVENLLDEIFASFCVGK